MAGKTNKRARSDTQDDQDKLKDAAQKLRAENRHLKKENSTLRKELNRIADKTIDRDADDEFQTLEKTSENRDTCCSACKRPGLIEISAGLYTIHFCEHCGHKKRTKVKS